MDQELSRKLMECNTQIQELIRTIGNKCKEMPIDGANIVSRSKDVIQLAKLYEIVNESALMLKTINENESSNIKKHLAVLDDNVNRARNIMENPLFNDSNTKTESKTYELTQAKNQGFSKKEIKTESKKEVKTYENQGFSKKETKRVDNIKNDSKDSTLKLTSVSSAIVEDTVQPKVETKKIENVWVNKVKGTGIIPQSLTNNESHVVEITEIAAMPTRRSVADEVDILAYPIKNPVDCHKHKGWWCWCATRERFYLSLNGMIMEAITSDIRPASDTPYKYYEHRDCETNGNELDFKTTDYYVPRMFNPKSRDKRRFTSRMTFVPASKEPRPNQIYTFRLGSRETLKMDRQCITPSDYRLASDFTGNMLLCWTATTQYLTEKNNSEKSNPSNLTNNDNSNN